MSEVFVDTSAIYAFLVAEDENHREASVILDRLDRDRTCLVTSSFVLQETIALLQARIGIQAVRTFQELVLPALEVTWIDDALYQRGVAALLAAGNRRISLTDWTSFEVMRSRGIRQALAFDEDFAQQGFTTLE